MLFQDNSDDLLKIEQNVSTALSFMKKMYVVENNIYNGDRPSIIIILDNKKLPLVPQAKKESCERIYGALHMDLFGKQAQHFVKAGCFVEKEISEQYLDEIDKFLPEPHQSYQQSITPLDNKDMPYVKR